jgi:AraC-like DNA-binding protein
MNLTPKLHIVPKALDNAFSLRHDILPHFGTVWHYHPEIELHYLIKGEGTRFIGDHIGNFQQDDMILMGSNLPHTWKCNLTDLENGEHVEALVLHFHPECFGKDFLNYAETQAILRLIEHARNGLLIHGTSKEIIKELLWKMKPEKGLSKLIHLLEIFKILLDNQDYEVLSNNIEYSKFNKLDESRIDKIFSYTLQNFKEKIFIEDVAGLANLSVTSFCRYFKITANKSYFDFLTEVRLNHACRLILESDYTIQNIALDSGFENTSNFYRHFKNVRGITPKEYKARFLVR